jgi:hypothetical protein
MPALDLFGFDCICLGRASAATFVSLFFSVLLLLSIVGIVVFVEDINSFSGQIRNSAILSY